MAAAAAAALATMLALLPPRVVTLALVAMLALLPPRYLAAAINAPGWRQPPALRRMPRRRGLHWPLLPPASSW